MKPNLSALLWVGSSHGSRTVKVTALPAKQLEV